VAQQLRKGGPCQGTACGWKYEGFHICLNQPFVLMTRIEDGRNYVDQETVRESKGPVTGTTRRGRNNPEARRRIANSLRERSANDPQKQERNQEIIRLYNEEEMSMREIGERMHVSAPTVMNVLHQAAGRGDVIIRKAARRTGRY
jgi:predicted DNA-binding protein (UPF0251 family)